MELDCYNDLSSGYIEALRLDGRKMPKDLCRLEDAVTLIVAASFGSSYTNGWWHDRKTGEPIIDTRNPGEMIALIHSEISEALEGVRKDKMDEHLPHHKSETVEMADAIIRICDYCGARGLPLGSALVDKLAYNDERSDHKPENRAKEGGKAF